MLPYLHDLGVSHVYLSPVLQATPGSTHGYDVVDHARLSEDLGGAEAFHRLSDRARELGLGIVVDVVPNHMAVPTPASLNAALWSVLRTGPASPYARWFDVEWEAQERALLMPVLGDASARSWRTARSPSTATPRASTGRCCATSTMSSPSAPAPRTCRCRPFWTGSSTGWRTGGSATRS